MAGGSDAYGNDPADYTTAGGGSVQQLIDASTGVNSGWSFDQDKSPYTATTNAGQSMAPITTSGAVSDSAFSSYWAGLIGSVVKTGEAVVAKQNGLIQPTSTTPVTTPPPNPNRGLLLVALGIGVVVLVMRKG